MSCRVLFLRGDGTGVLLGPFDSLLDATLSCRLDTRPAALLDGRGVIRCFRGQTLPRDRERLTELAAAVAGRVSPRRALQPTRTTSPTTTVGEMCARLVQVFRRTRGGR